MTKKLSRTLEFRVLLVPKDDLETDVSTFKTRESIDRCVKEFRKYLRKQIKDDEAIVGHHSGR